MKYARKTLTLDVYAEDADPVTRAVMFCYIRDSDLRIPFQAETE